MPHNHPLDLTNIETFNGIKEQITQEDINEGVACNQEQCPLARALWNMFPGCQVFVDDYIEVSHKASQTHIEIAMSDELTEWINDFDDDKPVSPIPLILSANTDEDPPITLSIDSENTDDPG